MKISLDLNSNNMGNLADERFSRAGYTYLQYDGTEDEKSHRSSSKKAMHRACSQERN